MTKRNLKRVQFGVFAALAMAVVILTPNSITMDPYPISEFRNSSGCAAVPLENFGLIKLRAVFNVQSHPNEFAVIFATDRYFSQGIATTIDKYGNIFLSMSSSDSLDNYQYAVFLSPPVPKNSKQTVEVDIYADKSMSIKFNGNYVPIVDVNNNSPINTRLIKTEFNEICINQFGSKNLSGTAFVVLKKFDKPIQIQLPFFRVLLLLCTLGFALLLIK